MNPELKKWVVTKRQLIIIISCWLVSVLLNITVLTNFHTENPFSKTQHFSDLIHFVPTVIMLLFLAAYLTQRREKKQAQ